MIANAIAIYLSKEPKNPLRIQKVHEKVNLKVQTSTTINLFVIFKFVELTSPPFFNLLGSFDGSCRSFLLLLLCATSMEIFDNYSNEHVQDEKSNQQQEGNKVK